MAAVAGRLCEEVLSQPKGDEWSIEFGLVALSLPAASVHNEPGFSEFLRRKVSARDVRSESQWVHALLDLLGAQGCLTLSDDQILSVDGLSRLHGRFANWWYRRYYGHPIWKRLRADLSRELFAHWAKRTYFLSKSAGATASRSVVSSLRPAVRSAFLKSAIEEYTHHHSFYALQPLLTTIGHPEVAEQGPTPGCVAFDDQMLSIAGHDDLAHVFVALFQERTAEFSDKANEFYDHVEKQLAIAGALTGWRTHISYDHSHGHASDLDALLGEFGGMSVDATSRSVRQACATIDFLVESLDEMDQFQWLVPTGSSSDRLRKDVLGGLGYLLVAAMSHSVEHPALLVAFGRMLEMLTRRHPVQEPQPPTWLGALAIVNRLEHVTAQPDRFAYALVSLLPQLGEQGLIRGLASLLQAPPPATSRQDASYLRHAIAAWDRPIHCFQALHSHI